MRIARSTENPKLTQMFNKFKGGNYHGYYNGHHCHRRVGSIVRRRRRLLLDQTTVGIKEGLAGIFMDIRHILLEVEAEWRFISRIEVEMGVALERIPCSLRLLSIEARLSCFALFKVSLNIVRCHKILRSNKSFHTSLICSPINLIACY